MAPSVHPIMVRKPWCISAARYLQKQHHVWRRVAVQRTCALDIMLFTEAVSAKDPQMAHLFPVNSLRWTPVKG